jgi:hypothetical protein
MDKTVRESEPVLFTYRVTHDTGFAPNPYWGICTLVTCKPRIRTAASVGDWVAGIGSRVAKCRSVRNRLIFAMRVSEKMTLREYDAFTSRNLRGKIPDLQSRNPKKRIGDAIFDFSMRSPKLRPSRHSGNRKALKKDLDGRYALLSDHFFYFGENAISVPHSLRNTIPGRGHRSRSNRPYVKPFIRWMKRFRYQPNILYGDPSSALPRECFVPKPTFQSNGRRCRERCR